MNILPLFCEIDDFFLAFEKYQAHRQLPGRRREKRGRPRTLHPSEVMTILVNFHQSQYRTFKDYYLKEVCLHLRWAFSTPGELQPVCRPQIRGDVCGVCLSLHTLG